MKTIVLFFLFLLAGVMPAQNRAAKYYFDLETTDKDSLILRAQEFLELSGHVYRYTGDEKGDYGIRLLVFEREERYWDGDVVKARVIFDKKRLPDRTEGGLDYYEDIDVSKRKYKYSLNTYMGEFDDLFAIWAKIIDPQHAEREQLSTAGATKGPGETRNYPGVFKTRQDGSGYKWDFRFCRAPSRYDRNSYSAYQISGDPLRWGV